MATATSNTFDITISDTGAAEADWLARKTAATLWATRFDTNAEAYGDDTVVDSDLNFYDNYILVNNTDGLATPSNPSPYIIRQENGGICGGPFLRLYHPASEDADVGAWRRMFVDNQGDWPKGTTLYHSLMIRLDDAKVNQLTGDARFWKTNMMAGYGKSLWGSTNQGAELTQSNVSANGIIQHYTAANQGLITDDFPDPGDFQFQNQRDLGSGGKYDRYCLYNQYNTGSCVRYQADTWMELYYEVTPRTNGNVDIEIYCMFEGDSQRTHLESYSNYNQWDTLLEEYWNTVTIMSYTTGRSSGNVDCHYDVSEVILSENPISPRTVWTADFPTWRQGMAINEWKQVSTSTPSSLAGQINPNVNSFIDDIIRAWNGSCVDPRNSKVYMLGSGGHNGWYGNQVIAFPLEDDNPQWELLRDASYPTANATEYGPDGRPGSSHTYCTEVFSVERNRAMRFGMGSAGSGSGAELPNVDGFNPDTNDWDSADTYVDLHNGTSSWMQGQPTVRDPQTGDVYYARVAAAAGDAHIAVWRQADNTSEYLANTSYGDNWQDGCGAFDSTRRRAFFHKARSSNYQAGYWDIDSGTWVSVNSTISGPRPSTEAGMVYIPQIDKYIFRSDDDTGGAVYQMDPVTFVCSALTTSGGSSITIGNTNGTYSKFNYAPNLGGCYLVTNWTEPVWFIKLHDVGVE